jgi:hypothetical protein
MDIRAELRFIAQTLRCHHFQSIPHKLDAIKRSVAKPRPKRRAKAKR